MQGLTSPEGRVDSKSGGNVEGLERFISVQSLRGMLAAAQSATASQQVSQ
jgi:hypothetical protein